MSGHAHRLFFMSLLALNAVRAHEHDDVLSEEAASASIDSILWIHIFLQAAVWGILFPIGMVLGLSRSRWHVPLQVRPSAPTVPLPSVPKFPFVFSPVFVRQPVPYHGFALADSLCALIVGHRFCTHVGWLHTRARSRWPTISSERACQVCKDSPRADRNAACAWCVSQAAHPRTDAASLGRAGTWRCRKVVSGLWMGPDGLWCDCVSRILSRWRPWAVSRTLYHGA